jgi:Domain of unknown function (DUF4136)
MKHIILFSFLALLTGCSRVFVDNDYRYSGNFKKYVNYAFVDCPRDTTSICEDVQQAIEYQMRARGYQFNAQKPNVYVNYAIYEAPLRYQGYDQPALVNWISNEDDRSIYKPVKHHLGQGTLMISIIEAESSEVVWRGYATGIFNKASSKKNYFKSIVRNIYDQYPLMARGEVKRRILDEETTE